MDVVWRLWSVDRKRCRKQSKNRRLVDFVRGRYIERYLSYVNRRPEPFLVNDLLYG